MNHDLVSMKKRKPPNMWVAVMINKAGITGLRLFLHFNGVFEAFSLVGEDSSESSSTQAASTHVPSPWNIIATLISMALGK